MQIQTSQYPIFFGRVSQQLNQWLANTSYTDIIVLVDENTNKHCLPLLDIQQSHFLVQIPSGELNKNLSSCQYIWRLLLDYKIDRNALIINLGGGMVSDIGGFCAATYKRGIDFINIPTSLLAMVDATAGGKTGIDYLGYKNVVGLFANPKAIFVDAYFLATLPKRELKSGWAEVIKHALISSETHWKEIVNYELPITNDELQNSNFEDWNNLIQQSIAIKNEIVAVDPYEKNERKKLNYGHTIGHALESHFLKTDKPLLHGEAVSWGIVLENKLAPNLPENQRKQIETYIHSLYNFPELPNFKALLPFLKNDKKNQNGNIGFTLLNQIGEARVDHFIDINLIKPLFE